MLEFLFILLFVAMIWRTLATLKGWLVLSSKARWKRLGWIVAAWVVMAPILAFLLLLYFASNKWPPTFYERIMQRQKVRERVEQAGGWESLRRDIFQIANSSHETAFYWMMYSTNGFTLPKSLNALKPQQISYFPYRYDPHNGDPVKVDVVAIKIFGMHSTGGHSTPYYGFEIVWGPGTNRYHPKRDYRQIAPNIYEVY